jgi:hypothetical protein
MRRLNRPQPVVVHQPEQCLVSCVADDAEEGIDLPLGEVGDLFFGLAGY